MSDNIFKHFKWHWSLEKISESFNGDRWCVFDTDELVTLSDEATPEEAIRKAIVSPLTENQQKHSVKYLLDWQQRIAELQSTITEQADLIRRLKEDNERLSQSFIEQNNICVHCGSVVCTEFGYYEQLHTDNCPITLHFILMEKLKQEGI
jgi:hypothetical protein